MPVNIAALKALRDLDEKIHSVREEQSAQPARLREAEADLAAARKTGEAKRDEIKEVRKLLDEKNRDLKGMEDKVEKLSVQVNTAKTNKEYQALQNEIQTQKADGSKLEDAALVLMNREEDLRKEEQGLAKIVAEKDAAVGALRKEIEASIAALARKVEDLNGRREQTLTALDPTLLVLYQRILNAKKDGLALAPVDGGACGVCYANLNSQEINLLMKNRDVVLCRSCSRILYLDAPAK